MLKRMKSAGTNIKNELKVYRLVLKDKRTPKTAKILLGLAVAYAVSPIDIIPDFIPVIGYIDDIIIVPALVMLAMKMVPREVLTDCRNKCREETCRAVT